MVSRPQFTLPHALEGDVFGWGPAITPEALDYCLGDAAAYPFEPAAKQERLGRVCDFTYSTMQRNQRDGRSAVVQVEDEAEFQLVDSRPVKLNRYKGFVRRTQQRRDQPQRQQIGQQSSQQNLMGQQLPRGPQSQQVQTQRQYQQQQQQRQQQWQRTNRQRQLAEWSVEPQHDWQMVEVRQLSQLPTLSLKSNQVQFEDFEWRGSLRLYNKACDRLLPKTAVQLSDVWTKKNSFYWPGSGDDSILISKFDADTSINVAATDQILACLMAAAQGRLSWHLIFHKMNGRLFMDKQNGSSVDMLTVDETHKEAPLSDNPIKMNRPVELAAEALKINQNFSQQVLDHTGDPVRSYKEAPFVEEGDIPATKLYRYRIITLPGQPYAANEYQKQPIKIVTRSEIDAILPGCENGYVAIHALNEYSPLRSIKPWRVQLELQKGALLAQESKNNHCKVGKWVCQAMIAGVENIKIGFVTRNSPDNNDRHTILNVQTFKVRELGVQIGLREDNAWGIVRAIIDLVMGQPDGKYTLIKDPVKPEIKLYNTQSADENEDVEGTDGKEEVDGTTRGAI